MCLSSYDTSAVRRLLVENAEERGSKSAALLNAQKEKKRKIQTESAALREAALEECRRLNMLNKTAKNPHNGGGDNTHAPSVEDVKGSGDNISKQGKSSKNIYDPTPTQLSSMVEDLRLRQNLGIDLIVDSFPEELIRENKSANASTRGALASARVLEAELERQQKEQHQARVMRDDASAYLEHALETQTEREIRDSIKYAKQAGLEGSLLDGKKYCCSLLFKVRLTPLLPGVAY